MAEVKSEPVDPIDDPDERDITSEEMWESAIGSPDALCLARQGYFKDGILRRTGRCIHQLDHEKDMHSWQDQ